MILLSNINVVCILCTSSNIKNTFKTCSHFRCTHKPIINMCLELREQFIDHHQRIGHLKQLQNLPIHYPHSTYYI